jgi:hypothetical protein
LCVKKNETSYYGIDRFYGGKAMKIDKKSINMLLKLNDDNLWNALQYAISKSGNEALKSIERPSDMTKIRQTLSMLSEDDIQKAINSLKGGRENGGKQL